jgi:hypothetical protein
MESEHEIRRPARDDARDENGVDVTLIRWMLSLTPRQRLDVVQEACQLRPEAA